MRKEKCDESENITKKERTIVADQRGTPQTGMKRSNNQRQRLREDFDKVKADRVRKLSIR